MLNPVSSPYYQETKEQAVKALKAYPKGMQIGGGITRENAAFFLDKGAQKVIVTSHVFQGGEIHYKNLELLVKEIGKEKIKDFALEVRKRQLPHLKQFKCFSVPGKLPIYGSLDEFS